MARRRVPVPVGEVLMATQRGFLVVLQVAMVAVCLTGLWGCHADDNDPKGQAEELHDAVRREHAIGRLFAIMTERLAAAKGDRSSPGFKEFVEATQADLVKAYLEHPEDNQNGLKMLQLMAEMYDPRTIPALLKALEWQAEVSEDHAVTAANTLVKIDTPANKKGEVVAKICEALKKVTGARGVDNRLRKGFIEVLGKLKDKGATDTLMEIALRQDESQNFLFNKLAAQQMVYIKDPEAVDRLVKALYMFDAAQPMMRMEEDAESALVAIGKPSLAPLMQAAKGENPEVVKLVELSIDSFRRKDPELAATMSKSALVAREAVLTLGKLGMRDALDLLVSEAKSDNKDRRMTASLALVGITRQDGDTARVVEAMKSAYDQSEKQSRPQMLVAFRHLYANEVMPILLKVAQTTETELPPVQMYGWASYALPGRSIRSSGNGSRTSSCGSRKRSPKRSCS
jgi:HEAT repeat protein